jgi:indolepyruvate ferredoxin oxidoreductase
MSVTNEDSPATGSPLEDRYRLDAGRVVLSGVQALVRLVGDQRRADDASGFATAGFVSGYPGSPLAGLDLELARRARLLDEWGVVFRPAINEELAATAVAGSQLAQNQPDPLKDGVFALWYGKAPGLDRASDALRHGNLMGAGARGGVLVVVGDDPQAKSSSVPSSSEPAFYSLAMPFLSPADPQEVLDLGRLGIALSRASGLWVGLRLPASVADASQSVDVGPERVRPVAPGDGERGAYAHRVSAQLLGATLIELEGSLYGSRLEVARRFGAANALNRVTQRSATDVLGVVAAGPAFLTTLSALRKIGYGDGDLAHAGVRLFKVSLPYPLDEPTARDFAKGLREVLVVEDKRPFLETFIKNALYGEPQAPRVVGKLDEWGRELIPATGEVDVDALAGTLAARLVALREDRVAAAYLASSRPPVPAALAVQRGAYFCSGCPHNTSVRVADGVNVGSGSGCHGLAIQMNPRRVGNVVGRFQMGGEGAMWNGMAPFVASSHFVQNMGDGTFAHSGVLAVRAAVASGVNITFKLLVNDTVAMTGGQPISGGRGLAEMVRELRAEGVRRIIVTTDDPRRTRARRLPRGVDVWPRSRLVEAQRVLAATDGVTVLVHDQECALERRRHRRQGLAASPTRRVHINTLVCEGCGDCGEASNCLSVRPVETALGVKRQIHQESCNFDFTCLEGRCPALVTVRATRERRGPGAGRARLDASGLSDPPVAAPYATTTVRLTGIGGTGVLTVAQIVAMAAHLDGLFVREIDQTGIAQKGGAVVSDLRLSATREALSPRLGEGECDLYLVGDPLVAATSAYLGVTSPSRTLAVGSRSMVPTGRQVADAHAPVVAFDTLRERVDARTRRESNLWIDAARLSRDHLGADTYANVVLLGAAFQRGALGLRTASLRRAIELNGVDVARNLEAFDLGRRAGAASLEGASPPAGAEPSAAGPSAELVASVGAAPGGALASLLGPRVRALVAYRDLDYARRYVDVVRRAHAREAALGAGDAFARAVAEQLFRLMAYKDEYEVARLLGSAAARDEVERAFGPGAKVTFHVALRGKGERATPRKVAIGGGRRWVLSALARARRLRETPLDPFARSPLRREERRLRDEYLATVDELVGTLSADSLGRAVAIASAPAIVRGFGAVKLSSIAEYEARRRELLGVG